MKPITKLVLYTTLGLFIFPTTLLAQEKTVLEGTEKEIKEEQKDLDKKKDNASGLEKAEKNANKKAGQLEKAESNLENKEEAVEKAAEKVSKKEEQKDKADKKVAKKEAAVKKAKKKELAKQKEKAKQREDNPKKITINQNTLTSNYYKN